MSAEREIGMANEKATFGAGCFWGVEADFLQTPGVLSTSVGYSGGSTENPAYGQVCSEATGHAEVVEVEFDSETVSYEQLLEIFWRIHDPAQVNQQGPDFGSQYRSVIFYHSPEQREIAHASMERLDQSARYSRPAATQIVSAVAFHRAEEYHQRYFEKRGIAAL
jgi:peptide-methionine (S)-S-oxide reductase